LPNPDARELASLLQRKAAGDEAILVKLLDSDVPDDALGFHVQQAVEKGMKSAIRFGCDGKPSFTQGSYDDPGRVLRTLEESVGSGNFHFTVSTAPHYGVPLG